MAREMTPAEIADLLRQDPWFAEHDLLDTTLFKPPGDETATERSKRSGFEHDT